MSSSSTHREGGVVLIWAIIVLAVMAVIAVAIVMSTQGSLDRSRSKSDRVLAYPHVQSAVAKLGIALQSDLASPKDNYVISAADLEKLGVSGDNSATASQIPSQYRTQGGVWGYSGSKLTQVGNLPIAAYHEPASLSAAQCSALNISKCEKGIDGWWQVYRIELPNPAATGTVSQVVYYLRSWVAPPPSAAGSAPRSASDAVVVRVAARPGRFADYQLISDGTVVFKSGATINGPVHSNGFDTADPATGGSPSPYAMELESGVKCGAGANLTTASKPVSLGSGVSCTTQTKTNRYITFMRVQTQLDMIAADNAGRPDVHVLPTYDVNGIEPFDHAYRLRLMNDHVEVKAPNGGGWKSYAVGNGNGAMLFQDDVIIEGGDLYNRFTIATSRPSQGAASIYLTGNVNQNVTANGQTLGLIAQGNVVIAQGRGSVAGGCNVTMIRAAIVAAAGGLTIPPEYATQQVQAAQPSCAKQLTIAGSIAAHRPPLLYWQWYNGDWTGYSKRSYTHDKRLINATPPYFPLTGSWQATNVREANVDCYAGSRKNDASCE